MSTACKMAGNSHFQLHVWSVCSEAKKGTGRNMATSELSHKNKIKKKVGRAAALLWRCKLYCTHLRQWFKWRPSLHLSWTNLHILTHFLYFLVKKKKKDKCNTKRLVEHFTFARLSFNSEWTCSQSHSDLGAFPSPLNCFLVSFSSTVFGSVGKKQQQKCRK